MPALNRLARKRHSLALAVAVACAQLHAAESTPEKPNTHPASASYQTVSFYAEYHDHVVRWPDGDIKVYDKTGFSQWPVIFERLRPFVPRLRLNVVTEEASADIIVDAVETLPMPYENSCGVTQNYLGADNASIKKSRIKIRRIPLCIGENKELGLYFHELGHALGFARHTKDADVMGTYENHGKEIHIQTLAGFLTGLYTLDVGAPIPADRSYVLPKQATDWSVPDGKEIGPLVGAPVRQPSAPEPKAVAAEKPTAAASESAQSKPVPQSTTATDKVATPVVAVKTPPAAPSEPKKEAMPQRVASENLGNSTAPSDKQVAKPKAEEPIVYLPLAVPNSLRLRPVTVIGPNGTETRWVMDDKTQEAPVSLDGPAAGPLKRVPLRKR